jgi:hypothetical protein
MHIKPRTLLVLALALSLATLASFGIARGLGSYSDQAANSGNTFSSVASFSGASFHSPFANVADSGGDNDGFETNPTYAYADDALSAENQHGPGDRHIYYNFGVAPASGSTIQGIRVRLDWWVNAASADNSTSVELSWDGGTSWTAAKTDAIESTSEHTSILGGGGDLWGRTWTADELSDTDFRIRITCNCTNGAECVSRNFYLDWVAVGVYYTGP